MVEVVETLSYERQWPTSLYSQYHGFLRRQVISNHDIDVVNRDNSVPAR